MSISVNCPQCGRAYSVKDDAAGKKFKCKDCEAVIAVPDAGGGLADDDYGDSYGGTDDDDDDFGAPTPAAPKARRKKSRGNAEAAAERLKIPAIIIIVLASITVLLRLAMVGMVLAGVGMMQQQPGMNQDFAAAQMIGGIMGNVAALLFNIVTIIGAVKMMKLESYGLAMTAAVLSVIPCCSPCVILGIPFGIWALIVLNDPDVKNSFS